MFFSRLILLKGCNFRKHLYIMISGSERFGLIVRNTLRHDAVLAKSLEIF